MWGLRGAAQGSRHVVTCRRKPQTARRRSTVCPSCPSHPARAPSSGGSVRRTLHPPRGTPGPREHWRGSGWVEAAAAPRILGLRFPLSLPLPALWSHHLISLCPGQRWSLKVKPQPSSVQRLKVRAGLCRGQIICGSWGGSLLPLSISPPAISVVLWV